MTIKKSKLSLMANQAGIAHLGLLLLFVAVLGGVGFAGYTVYQKNNDSQVASSEDQSGEVNDEASIAEEENNADTATDDEVTEE